MTPSWYDILDVDEFATAEEIEQAWRTSIEGLVPGDRRFRLRNEAAEILLDENRRAEYDASLGLGAWESEADETYAEPAPELAPEYEYEAEAEGFEELVEDDVADNSVDPVETSVETSGETSGETGATESTLLQDSAVETGEVAHDEDESEPAPDFNQVLAPVSLDKGATPEKYRNQSTEPARDRSVVSVVGMVALVAVTVLAVIATVLAWNSTEETEQVATSAELAQSAAEEAVIPLLAYDYENLEQSKAAALNFLSPEFADEYEKFFAQIAINAEETETTVTVQQVVASGIARATPDEVDVYLFIDRPTTNKAQPEPRVFRDQVTMEMKRIDGTWLVDGFRTGPAT